MFFDVLCDNITKLEEKLNNINNDEFTTYIKNGFICTNDNYWYKLIGGFLKI